MSDLRINQRWQRPRRNFGSAFFYELAASAVVAVIIWGIGTAGLGLVALEAHIIVGFGINPYAIATSGINGLYLLLTAPLILGVMSYLLLTWSHGYKGPAELIPLLKERSSEFPGWIRATITWVIACIELGSGLSPKGFEGPYIAAAGGLSGWFATRISFDAAARRRVARCGLGVAFGVLFHTTLGGFVCTFEFGGFERSEFRRLLPVAALATLVSWLLTSVPLVSSAPTTQLPAAFMPGLVITRPQTNLSHPGPEILLLLLVGAWCGIAGVAYTNAIQTSKQLFARLATRVHLVLIPVIGASLSTVLGFLFPVIIGPNELSRAITQQQISILSRQVPWAALLLCGAIVAKIMATASADGSKCAGGTVGPAILLGGLIGRLVGVFAGASNTIFAAAGSAAVIGPIAGLSLTMYVTVVQWCITPASISIPHLPGLAILLVELALPILLAKALCWRTGTELYPYKPSTAEQPSIQLAASEV